jgi:hypothetical protein
MNAALNPPTTPPPLAQMARESVIIAGGRRRERQLELPSESSRRGSYQFQSST